MTESYQQSIERYKGQKTRAGYIAPRARNGCHNCRFAKPDPTNTRIRCRRGKFYFTVHKMGICNSHETELRAK